MFGSIGVLELLVILLTIYTAVCIGKISSRLGRNGLLFGLLSLIPFVNFVIISILAFSEPRYDNKQKKQIE